MTVLLEQRPFLGAEEAEAVRRVLESGWLGMGLEAQEFEAELRRRLGVRHAAACQTGTAALHLGLAAAGIGAGDDVVVPSMTHVASVQAIVTAGGRPVFCEVRPDTLTIDVEDALARVTPATKAIMPVHYGGAACEMDALLPAARALDLRVVEDAAQAFGSTYRGRAIGTLGDVACFSFDPVKNITCGEGGAVVTDDAQIAARVLGLRGLGIDRDSWARHHSEQPWAYAVVGSGFRYTLSDINAAIGLEQLKRYDAFRARKTAIALTYDEAFSDVPGILPIARDLGETFPFLYTLRVLEGRRDALVGSLSGSGIQAWVRPLPNHVQPAFAAFAASLPVSEQLYREVMTLPFYFDLSDGDCARVIDAVRSFFGRAG